MHTKERQAINDEAPNYAEVKLLIEPRLSPACAFSSGEHPERHMMCITIVCGEDAVDLRYWHSIVFRRGRHRRAKAFVVRLGFIFLQPAAFVSLLYHNNLALSLIRESSHTLPITSIQQHL